MLGLFVLYCVYILLVGNVFVDLSQVYSLFEFVLLVMAKVARITKYSVTEALEEHKRKE